MVLYIVWQHSVVEEYVALPVEIEPILCHDFGTLNKRLIA